jgi:hypothetical protein
MVRKKANKKIKGRVKPKTLQQTYAQTKVYYPDNNRIPLVLKPSRSDLYRRSSPEVQAILDATNPYINLGREAFMREVERRKEAALVNPSQPYSGAPITRVAQVSPSRTTSTSAAARQILQSTNPYANLQTAEDVRAQKFRDLDRQVQMGWKPDGPPVSGYYDSQSGAYVNVTNDRNYVDWYGSRYGSENDGWQIKTIPKGTRPQKYSTKKTARTCKKSNCTAKKRAGNKNLKNN